MTTRQFLGLLLVIPILSTPAVGAGKRYALVVGVDKYRSGQPLPPLAYTENDVDGLAKVLKAGGYDVTLMTRTVGRGEGTEELAPLSTYIRDQLAQILDNPFLGPEDIVVVAFAGHGVQYEFEESGRKTPRFYFCPADADVKTLNTANEVTARHNLLDLGEVYSALEKCKAGGKLLLVDACRNDPTKPDVVRSLASNTLPPLPPPPGGTVAFFSCSAHQKAFEDPELGGGHGVFFHHVIEALGGAADSSTPTKTADGAITLSELAEHVSASTYDHVRRKYRAKQAPELKGDLRLNMPLIVLSKPSPTNAPTSLELLYQLAQAQELEGKTDEAIETNEAARKLLPNNQLLDFQHGWICLHAGRLDEAIRLFEEVLKAYPDGDVERRVRLTLSNAYDRKGEARKAEEVLEVILEAEPDDPSVNNDLGFLYARRDDKLEQAEAMIRKAVEAEPENHAYQDSMGWVLYRRGQYQKALPWILKASEESDAEIWGHLGDCYAKLDRKDDAIAAYKKGLSAIDGGDKSKDELRMDIQTKLKALDQP